MNIFVGVSVIVQGNDDPLVTVTDKGYTTPEKAIDRLFECLEEDHEEMVRTEDEEFNGYWVDAGIDPDPLRRELLDVVRKSGIAYAERLNQSFENKLVTFELRQVEVNLS